MQWEPLEFEFEASRVLKRYRTGDWWFSWGDDTAERNRELIEHAWLLYKAANENELQGLILGDAKIRSGNLLMNFGLASGNGLEDARELEQIGNIRAVRQGLAQGTGEKAVDPLGKGSILNDKNWTPLLNDAFILGGVHANQYFDWAEEGFSQYNLMGEQEFLQTRDKFGPVDHQYKAAMLRDSTYQKRRLKEYLYGHSNFWSGGLVRIFARELIGLKRFHYTFRMTSAGFNFSPSGQKVHGTFNDYLDALADVSFFDGNAELINGALGEFLFQDRNALQGLQRGQAAFTKPKLNKVDKPADWPKPPGK